VPIVEFALEDVRELKKKEKILQKLKGKAEQQKKEEKEKPKKEKKENVEEKNAEKLAKIKIEQYLQDGKNEYLPQVKALLKKIHSRGLKQRLKKRVAQTFKTDNFDKANKKPAVSKLQAKVDKKEKEKQAKVNRTAQPTQKAEKPQKKAEPKKFESLGEDLGLVGGEDEAALIRVINFFIEVFCNKK